MSNINDNQLFLDRKERLSKKQRIEVYCNALVNTLKSEKLLLSDDERDEIIENIDKMKQRVNKLEWSDRREGGTTEELLQFIESDPEISKFSVITKEWLKVMISDGSANLIDKAVFRIDNLITRVYVEIPEYISLNKEGRINNLRLAVRNYYDDPNTPQRDDYIKIDIERTKKKNDPILEKLSNDIFDFIVKLI